LKSRRWTVTTGRYCGLGVTRWGKACACPPSDTGSVRSAQPVSHLVTESRRRIGKRGAQKGAPQETPRNKAVIEGATAAGATATIGLVALERVVPALAEYRGNVTVATVGAAVAWLVWYNKRRGRP
jgi:hypothetical protein